MPADRLTQAVPFQFIKSVKKFSTKLFSMFLRAFSCCSFIKVSFDFLVIKHDSRDTDQHFRDRKCKPGKAQIFWLLSLIDLRFTWFALDRKSVV